VNNNAVQGVCMPTHIGILTGGANGKRLASEDNNEGFTLNNAYRYLCEPRDSNRPSRRARKTKVEAMTTPMTVPQPTNTLQGAFVVQPS
jgi:hypothetical protein